MINDLYLWSGSDDDAERVAFYLHWFHSAIRPPRLNFEGMWEEGAMLAWPEYRGLFTFMSDRSPGVKQTQYQLDSKCSISSGRFGAVAHSIMTPDHLPWSYVQCSNRELRKNRNVKLYFSEISRILWEERYKPEANFTGQQTMNWHAMGVFGNMPMWTEEFKAPHLPTVHGLSYRALPIGEVYVIEDAQGRVCGCVRAFRRTAAQAYTMWPKEKIPPAICTALEQHSPYEFTFLQFVHPRTDYMPFELLTPRGKPWASIYISVEGQCIMEEGGYRSFPLAYGRYTQAPGEVHGRGPMQTVLAAAKTKNAQKGVFLRQGHLAGDPAYLIGDDGLFDFKTHAGAFNYTQFVDGRPQVAILPTGDIQITKEMMDVEDQFIDDAFLTSLYQIMWRDAAGGKGGQRSAREVIEYIAERGVFLAPTLGRQNSEYIAPMIDRELDILSMQGRLPPVPDELKEADGEYMIEYTNPMARAMQAQESAGSLQVVEAAAQTAQMTGDATLMDIFKLDEIYRDMGEAQMMRPSHFASAEELQAKAQARQQAQERDQRAKELPGLAAIEKAKAISAKAATGGNIGGALSGTPEGGMPMMPGGPGQPGMPGVGGRPGTVGRPGARGGY